MSARLRLHDRLPASRANGPGLRAVLWTQGCNLGCPGCFNPETHDRAGGTEVAVADLLAWLEGLPAEVEGLTVSGGEPLQQAAPLAELLVGVRARTPLSVVLFTGFAWDEIDRRQRRDAAIGTVLASVDVVIAGRYDASRHVGRGLLGSASKTLHCLTNRHRPEDFADVPEAEVVVTATGEIVVTGIGPVLLGERPPSGG